MSATMRPRAEKPIYAHAMWIYAQTVGLGPQQGDGPLRILQCHWHLGDALAVAFLSPIRAGAGNAILQQYAGDALPDEPVADLGTLQVDGQHAVATAREGHDRRAGIGRRRPLGSFWAGRRVGPWRPAGRQWSPGCGRSIRRPLWRAT